ncbi:CrcB-like protein-domain-containing protein [Umbelopsis sp. AD052]|nr:CrcB-like protein-domain-containing protein [Umbelopsis sp. AD052]
MQPEIPSSTNTVVYEAPNQQDKPVQLAAGPSESQYDSTGDPNAYQEAEIPDTGRKVSIRSGDQVGSKLDAADTTLQVNENKLPIVAALIPLSILGALIRIGLNLLETYNGAPVFGLAYAQFIGCVIMGVVVKKKDFLIKTYLPLQIALSTGLCGSITTFSSWQLGTFEAFANYAGADHARGYNVLAGLSQVLITLAVSVCGLSLGYHIAYALDHALTRQSAIKLDTRHYIITPVGYKFSGNVHDILCELAGLASWVAVIVIAATVTSKQHITLACVFAPLGTLVRWWLSRYNTRMAGFPLGTFIANILATLVLAIVTLLMSGPVSSSAGCNVLQGISDGFCGCLSTISTFTVEMTTLKLRAAYKYTMASLILGQIIMFVVLGSFIWTSSVWSPGVQTSCKF